MYDEFTNDKNNTFNSCQQYVAAILAPALQNFHSLV